MSLTRGFSEIDETGKISIPANLKREAGMAPGSTIVIAVVRVKGTGRRPHLVLHRPDHVPYISVMECVFLRGVSEVDEDGTISLRDELLEEAKVSAGDFFELKMHGSRSNQWVVAHNRGPHRATTLQERLGTRKRRQRRWPTISIDY